LSLPAKRLGRISGVSLSEKAVHLTLKQWTKQYRALAGNTAGGFTHLTAIPTIRHAKVRYLDY